MAIHFPSVMGNHYFIYSGSRETDFPMFEAFLKGGYEDYDIEVLPDRDTFFEEEYSFAEFKHVAKVRA